MPRDFDVLAAGDLNVDLILSGAALPQPGREVLAGGARYAVGGSAGIFAVNAAALGLSVALAARVGDDVPGQFLRDELRAARVETSGIITIAGSPTGVTVVFGLAGQHQKALVTCRGAMEELNERDVPDALLGRAQHVHLASYYLLPRLQADFARLIERVRAAGATISLDTNDDPSEQWSGGLPQLLRGVDVFFPNRREALAIARESDLCRAGEKLAALCGIVAIKADADGALLFTDGGRTRLRAAAEPVKFVEATGAGDSFDAGFLARWLGGATLEECLRFANACGARAVTAEGGTEAFWKR